jgi:hypothetical protein
MARETKRGPGWRVAVEATVWAGMIIIVVLAALIFLGSQSVFSHVWYGNETFPQSPLTSTYAHKLVDSVHITRGEALAPNVVSLNTTVSNAQTV